MEGLTLFKPIGGLYSDYHHYYTSKHNKLIHCILIPIVFITFFSMMAHIPMGSKAKFALLYPHAGLVMMISCACIYISLEIVSGYLTVAMMILFYVSGNLLYFGFGSYHMKVMAVLHVLGWVGMMVSTAYYEKRKPTIPQEITMTIATPLCLSVDVLYLVGYRPPFITKYGKNE